VAGRTRRVLQPRLSEEGVLLSCGRMGVREPSTPQRAPARAKAVASFYAALLVLGFFWHAVAQDSNDVWRSPEAANQTWGTLLLTPLIGVLAGLVTVQVFRALELRMVWLSDLHREFRSIFGYPRARELVLLAAASALGEEVLFRGAMLDAWGPWVSSLVFALLHIPPKRSLWPWTASSLVLGMGLAGLTLATGNLGAAVAAHFVINLQNLAYITRRRPRMPVGPVRPNPR
jgi:membrane protease YdiL (CAAX protease family)